MWIYCSIFLQYRFTKQNCRKHKCSFFCSKTFSKCKPAQADCINSDREFYKSLPQRLTDDRSSVDITKTLQTCRPGPWPLGKSASGWQGAWKQVCKSLKKNETRIQKGQGAGKKYTLKKTPSKMLRQSHTTVHCLFCFNFFVVCRFSRTKTEALIL